MFDLLLLTSDRARCIAKLESHVPTAGSSEMHSSLTVVWFQETLAPPIDEEVAAHLRALDWDSLAWSWTP